MARARNSRGRSSSTSRRTQPGQSARSSGSETEDDRPAGGRGDSDDDESGEGGRTSGESGESSVTPPPGRSRSTARRAGRPGRRR